MISLEVGQKCFDTLDAISSCVVRAGHPQQIGFGNEYFVFVEILFANDEMNLKLANRGYIDRSPESHRHVSNSHPPVTRGIEKRHLAGRSDRGGNDRLGMKEGEPMNKLTAA